MRSKRPPRTTLMNFKTSAPDAKRLKEAAAKQGVTVSTFINNAVLKAIEDA